MSYIDPAVCTIGIGLLEVELKGVLLGVLILCLMQIL